MNKRLALFAALGALIAAVILFFLLGGGGDKKKEPAKGPAQARTTEPASGAHRPPKGEDSGESSGEQPILVDDDPKGTQRLEGQVIDDKDQPVGGATVVLSSNPPRSVLTEDDGSFAFDNLVGRPYQIAARAAAR